MDFNVELEKFDVKDDELDNNFDPDLNPPLNEDSPDEWRRHYIKYLQTRKLPNYQKLSKKIARDAW